MGFQGESKRSAAADLCGISTPKSRISGAVGLEAQLSGSYGAGKWFGIRGNYFGFGTLGVDGFLGSLA